MNKKEIPLDLKSLSLQNFESLRGEIPNEFFKIEFYNQISFIIFEHLNISFKKCEELLMSKNQNKFDNLIALFYHHINALLCSYLFSISELNIINKKNAKGLFSNQQKEWSISYSQINSNKYNLPTTKRLLKENVKRFFDLLNNPKYKLKDSKVFLHPGCSSESIKIVNFLNKKNITISNNIKVFSNKVNIKLVDEQLLILKNEISHICNKFNSKDSKIVLSLEIIIYNIISKKIKKHVSSKQGPKYKFKFAVLDSLGDLESRKIAMQCRSQNIPVMSLAHGESRIMDEPLFGPVELTYCNYYISYGTKSCSSLKNGKYTKSLFDDELKIIPSSSNQVFNLFKKNTINKIKNINSKKVMYVPTSFSGNARYGPFRDIHDIAYLYWQRELIKLIQSNLNPKKISIKYHLKSKFNFYLDMLGLEVIKQGNFLDYINKWDLFIFDFPGSAFSLALATDKPVIYFDVGFRNLTKDALIAIKERCIYVKLNPSKPNFNIKFFRNELLDQKINNFTESFCLGGLDKNREETISQSIYKYL